MLKPGLRYTGSCTLSARVRGAPQTASPSSSEVLSLTGRVRCQGLHSWAPMTLECPWSQRGLMIAEPLTFPDSKWHFRLLITHLCCSSCGPPEAALTSPAVPAGADTSQLMEGLPWPHSWKADRLAMDSDLRPGCALVTLGRWGVESREFAGGQPVVVTSVGPWEGKSLSIAQHPCL